MSVALSSNTNAAPAQNGFPAKAFIRDWRAAGGALGIYRERVFCRYSKEAGTSAVDQFYMAGMRADSDHRAKIRAVLEAEAATLRPADLAVLHAC
jgi:hypothetical protein